MVYVSVAEGNVGVRNVYQAVASDLAWPNVVSGLACRQLDLGQNYWLWPRLQSKQLASQQLRSKLLAVASAVAAAKAKSTIR